MLLHLILRLFDNPVYLKENLNVEFDIQSHLTAAFKRVRRHIIEFNGGEISNTNVFITGGDAKPLNFIQNEEGIKSTVLKHPKTAQSEAI